MSKTNYEYFKDEIKALILDGENIAVMDGKPVACNRVRCSECLLDNTPGNNCICNRKVWFNAEHIEEPTPRYVVDDAIDYIYERTYIDRDVLRKILDVEEGYMRSIGLIEEE